MVRGFQHYGTEKAPFVLPLYTDYEPPFSLQRLVNIFPEKQGQQAQKSAIYRKCEGYSFWLGLNLGVILAHHVFKGFLYIATATKLLKIAPDQTFEVISEIAGADVIQIDNTASLLVMRIDSAIYTHTTDALDDLVQITDPDLQPSDFIRVLNNYVFSAIQGEEGQFQFSDFNTPSNYDALNFATAEYRADRLNAIIDVRNEFILFGDTSIEFWAVVGGNDVVRPRNVASNYGCKSPKTIKRIGDQLFFLGVNPLNNQNSVYILNGYSPQDITSAHVRKVLTGVDVSDAYAYTHIEQGYEFYTIVIPDVCAYSYCMRLDTWIERRSWDKNIGGFKNDVDVVDVFSFANKTLCYEKELGSLFALGGEKEADNLMPWEIITPYVTQKPKRTPIKEIELDVQSGAGNIEMSFSRDDGRTWSNGDWRQAPEYGQENTPMIWRRIGSPIRAAFRFRGYGLANITGGYIGS